MLKGQAYGLYICKLDLKNKEREAHTSPATHGFSSINLGASPTLILGTSSKRHAALIAYFVDLLGHPGVCLYHDESCTKRCCWQDSSFISYRVDPLLFTCFMLRIGSLQPNACYPPDHYTPRHALQHVHAVIRGICVFLAPLLCMS